MYTKRRFSLERICFSLLAVFFLVHSSPGVAESEDPLDPLGIFEPSPLASTPEEDEKKSADQLIKEASRLLLDERPLDARSKLLLVLKKDPHSFKAHYMLGSYYLSQVGHFRLALKYVKRAQELLYEQKGKPPYQDYRTQIDHGLLLYLLSQTRLNLDNYQGALDALDEYTSWGYYDDWYPGSRAWILMKLERLNEAVRVAQTGLLTMSRNSEKGQILNMLGILLSMTKQRAASIDIFKQAIRFELAMYEFGQPATPYNNLGEVYKEIFEDDLAETQWSKAISLKDGCEHVLPSLNLALLYIDQLNLKGAKDTMDKFESCIAQYPLRNGEEHKALVHLVRGRIALLTGDVEKAIDHLTHALERQQWFGKIGASIQDLQAGATISLSQAYARKTEIIRFTPYTIGSLPELLVQETEAALKSWWYRRKAIGILLGELNDFEDLYIRSTDSLIEYTTLGETIRSLPPPHVQTRLAQMLKDDDRPGAAVYYRAYRAEIDDVRGGASQAVEAYEEVLKETRKKYDALLALHVMLMKARLLSEHSDEYRSTVARAFMLNRPSVRGYGLRMPINFSFSNPEIQDMFARGPYLLDNAHQLQYVVKGEKRGEEYHLQFVSLVGAPGTIKVAGKDLAEAVKKLTDEVFQIGW